MLFDVVFEFFILVDGEHMGYVTLSRKLPFIPTVGMSIVFAARTSGPFEVEQVTWVEDNNTFLCDLPNVDLDEERARRPRYGLRRAVNEWRANGWHVEQVSSFSSVDGELVPTPPNPAFR